MTRESSLLLALGPGKGSAGPWTWGSQTQQHRTERHCSAQPRPCSAVTAPSTEEHRAVGSKTYMVKQTLTLETDQCSRLSHLNGIKSNPDPPGPSSRHPLALQQLSFFTDLVVLSPTPVWPRPHPSSKRLLLTSPTLSWPANSLNHFPILSPSHPV